LVLATHENEVNFVKNSMGTTIINCYLKSSNGENANIVGVLETIEMASIAGQFKHSLLENF